MLSRFSSHSRVAFQRLASTLVIAEHTNGALSAATLSAITAAKSLNQPIHALVIGGGVSNVAQAVAKIDKVEKVDVIDSAVLEHLEAEKIVPVIQDYLKKNAGHSHVLATASSFSRNFLPRLAAVLDVSPVADVMSILAPDRFVRPCYAGNVITTVTSKDTLKLMTIRGTSFAAAPSRSDACPITPVDAAIPNDASSKWLSTSSAKSDRPDLATARVVVSGGRALKSGDNFGILYSLADKLKGAVGASRAAVDAGYVSNSLQVGQTGKVVAPDLYIAVGISGAIQHLAGMKDSKCIVAINKDPEAPIFQVFWAPTALLGII